MAPITAVATGIAPQVLEHPRLRQLHEALSALTIPPEENIRKTTAAEAANDDANNVAPSSMTTTIRQLVEILEPYAAQWPFSEQVRVVIRFDEFARCGSPYHLIHGSFFFSRFSRLARFVSFLCSRWINTCGFIH